MSLVSWFGFRKKALAVSEPRVVKPKTREEAIASINQQPIQEQSFGTDLPDANIEVTEIQSHFVPGLEDAAILYANGRVDDAANLLHMFLTQSPEQDELWQMLFDLYQANADQEKFEQLALDYTLKREKSPPAWRAIITKSHSEFAKGGASSGQLFSLRGRLDQTQAERIRLLAQAAGHAQVQLDLSGIAELTPEGCHLLRQALVTLQKKHTPLQLASGALIGLLQQYIARLDEQNPAWWLLLMQLYQLQGRQAAFEDLAVDYAVTFEVSPPSWEAGAHQVCVAEVAGVNPGEVAEQDSDGFALHGVLGAKAAVELSALKRYAASRDELLIDMSDVSRVEFAYVGILLDTLSGLGREQHQIAITGCNFMVYVLLVVMGVDQIASVSRKKR